MLDLLDDDSIIQVLCLQSLLEIQIEFFCSMYEGGLDIQPAILRSSYRVSKLTIRPHLELYILN